MLNVNDIIDGYCKIGLKPIPLYSNSKVPVGSNWNHVFDKTRVKSYFETNPSLNLGTLLGDVIDVEGDTSDSNDMLDVMFSGIPHPIYRSDKSKHHLFKNPFGWLTRITYNGVEIRGHNHQSALPPSIHPSGRKYQWLQTNNFVIPEMPGCLRKWINDNNLVPKSVRYKSWKKPICGKCGKRRYVEPKRFAAEIVIFDHLNCKWHCNQCKPQGYKQASDLIKSLKKPFNVRHQKIAMARNALLEIKKTGEQQVHNFLESLRKLLGRKYRFTCKKCFIDDKSIFFVDYYFYELRVCINIINSNPLMGEYCQLLSKHIDVLNKCGISSLFYEASEIVNNPNAVFEDILRQLKQRA